MIIKVERLGSPGVLKVFFVLLFIQMCYGAVFSAIFFFTREERVIENSVSFLVHALTAWLILKVCLNLFRQKTEQVIFILNEKLDILEIRSESQSDKIHLSSIKSVSCDFYFNPFENKELSKLYFNIKSVHLFIFKKNYGISLNILLKENSESLIIPRLSYLQKTKIEKLIELINNG